MAKNKGARIVITLRCLDCKREGNKDENKYLTTKSKTKKKTDYTTTKNRRNTPARLELKKFCPNCNSHTYQKEIK